MVENMDKLELFRKILYDKINYGTEIEIMEASRNLDNVILEYISVNEIENKKDKSA